MRDDLFTRVVAASGLSSIFAERAIERALRRAGLDPDTFTRAELKRGLPELERVLGTFMGPDDVGARIARIKRLGE